MSVFDNHNKHIRGNNLPKHVNDIAANQRPTSAPYFSRDSRNKNPRDASRKGVWKKPKPNCKVLPLSLRRGSCL